MPHLIAKSLETIKREMKDQDAQWAAIEAQMRALSSLGVAVPQRVVDELDEAFGASSPAVHGLHHRFC
jgi:hypothetical protein